MATGKKNPNQEPNRGAKGSQGAAVALMGYVPVFSVIGSLHLLAFGVLVFSMSGRMGKRTSDGKSNGDAPP